MKVLTLTQPWATLVAIGAKQIETRSWMTQHCGALAIHAAKTFPRWAKELCWHEPFRRVLFHSGLVDYKALPLGQIIAVGELTSILHVESLNPPEPERSFGDYSAGRYAWMLRNMRPIDPVKASGMLGLWECGDPSLLKEVPA